MALYPVIMAGGSGTRFWPLSRKDRPKQFLPLSGGEPLIVETLKRVLPLAPAVQAYVVCGKSHAPTVRALLPALPPANILVEPAARNTAPCIALAAAVVAARHDPRGLLAVLPSDHHIANPEAFRDALQRAQALALDGALVTIGLTPSRPETGFGYIERGEGAFEVARFVEKPDRATAETYLARGRHLWNAGVFVFRADRLLEEFDRHLPEGRAPLAAIRAAIDTPDFERVLDEQFPKMPAVSIDYGVMEKADRIAVVPAEFGWSDVGSFPSLDEVRPLDADRNVVEGETILVGVRNSVVLAKDRPIAVVGLENVVVVDAGDALLVCSKEKAQEVRAAVEALKSRGRTDLL